MGSQPDEKGSGSSPIPPGFCPLGGLFGADGKVVVLSLCSVRCVENSCQSKNERERT